MNKPANMFSIGEISNILGISRKIILNYENCGLIAPDKKNGANGNRYYTIDTLTRIKIIRLFQDYGLSLSEIREYLAGSVDLTSLIHRLEILRDNLDENIKNLYMRVATNNHEISETTLHAQTVYARSLTSADIIERTDFLRDTALIAINNYKTDFSKPQYFTEVDYSKPADVLFCATVSASSEGEGIIHYPETKALFMCHHGSYQSLNNTRELLLEYAALHQITHSGRFRQVFLEGPPQHKNPQHFITNVYLLYN